MEQSRAYVPSRTRLTETLPRSGLLEPAVASGRRRRRPVMIRSPRQLSGAAAQQDPRRDAIVSAVVSSTRSIPQSTQGEYWDAEGRKVLEELH